MKYLPLALILLVVASCNLTTDCPEHCKAPTPIVAVDSVSYAFIGLQIDNIPDHAKLFRNDEFNSFVWDGYYNDRDVEPSTTYKYRIVNYDTCGIADTTITVTTPRNPLPLPFAWFTVDTTIEAGVAFLEWSHPEHDDLRLYYVMRNNKQVWWGRDTYYKDEDIETGKSYTYRIIAENRIGQTASQDIYLLVPGASFKLYTAIWSANTELDLAGYKSYIVPPDTNRDDYLIYAGVDSTFILKLYVVAEDSAGNVSDNSDTVGVEVNLKRLKLREY